MIINHRKAKRLRAGNTVWRCLTRATISKAGEIEYTTSISRILLQGRRAKSLTADHVEKIGNNFLCDVAGWSYRVTTFSTEKEALRFKAAVESQEYHTVCTRAAAICYEVSDWFGGLHLASQLQKGAVELLIADAKEFCHKKGASEKEALAFIIY